MTWRRLAARRREMVASVAAVILALGTYAVVASGSGGAGGGVTAFNACIRESRFLVVVRHRPGNGVVETINDRARGALEGDVASDRGAPVIGGAAAAGGRYVMSTVTPLGRDASAIERCWDSAFPIADA